MLIDLIEVYSLIESHSIILFEINSINCEISYIAKREKEAELQVKYKFHSHQFAGNFLFFLKISFASKIRILNSSVKQSCNFISESLIATLISI